MHSFIEARISSASISALFAHSRRLLADYLGSPLATLAVAIFLWESYHFVPQADDAFISYRYAANLLHAHELVFNIGEYV
ncbi:hypothetical protein, partial [Parvibaculum sp.]|uniref:hypothetical protein n=1 Tax=Parvibaculum sp. TaxID=2024848 RepID=UPI002CBEF2F1